MPEAVPRSPRRDDTAADLGSLIHLGRIEAQPTPDAPTDTQTAPAPTPEDAADAALLNSALAGAGIDTAADAAVIQALAKLDTATVEAVARWVKTRKREPETGPIK